MNRREASYRLAVNSPEKACIGKSAYFTRQEAKRAARIHGNHHNAYRCPYCDGWHLGTKKKFKKDDAR